MATGPLFVLPRSAQQRRPVGSDGDDVAAGGTRGGKRGKRQKATCETCKGQRSTNEEAQTNEHKKEITKQRCEKKTTGATKANGRTGGREKVNKCECA